MRICELRDGAVALQEEADDEEERGESRGGGEEEEVVAVARLKAKRALVGAGARVLFYPTLLYNMFRNRFESEFRWWDRVDQYVLLGAVPFSSDVPHLKQLGVTGVVTLNEPYETLVPTSLYQAYGINHLKIPTRDYLFAPSLEDICRAVDFIHRNAMQGGSTYVHCKAGRGRSTTVVLCYLIRYRNMTPEAAWDHARSVRPRVLLAPSQWQAVKLFSTISTGCLSIQNSNLTCSVNSGEESGELIGAGTTRCLSIQSSNQACWVKFGEGCNLTSVADIEVYGYATILDCDHFVLPLCERMRSRPDSSPTGCSDAVLITDVDLEGYETYADAGKVLITDVDLEGYETYADGKDAVSVVVGRQKPIIRRLSCLFGSMKLISNCEQPPSRLAEVRAC